MAEAAQVQQGGEGAKVGEFALFFEGEPVEPIGGPAGERTHEVMLTYQAQLDSHPPLPPHMPLPENVRVLPREQLPVPQPKQERPESPQPQRQAGTPKAPQSQSKALTPAAPKQQPSIQHKEAPKAAPKPDRPVDVAPRTKPQTPVEVKTSERAPVETRDREKPELKERPKPEVQRKEEPAPPRTERRKTDSQHKASTSREQVDEDREEEQREGRHQHHDEEGEEERDLQELVLEVEETLAVEEGAPALPPRILDLVERLQPEATPELEGVPPGFVEALAGSVQGVADSIWGGLQQVGETAVWIAGLPNEASRHFLGLEDKERDPEIEHTAVDILVPFKCPDDVKAAIDRNLLERNFQVIILHVLMRRVMNVLDEFLKGVQRATFLDEHMKWVKYTQNEIRDTVEKQQTWGQWGMMAGTLIGTLGPSLVINQGFSDSVRKLWGGFPDFGDALVKGDWMKKAQGVGQMIPQAFQTQAQVYQTLGQAQQFGGQARSERSFKRADSAGNQISELKQGKVKVFDLGKSVIESIGGLARQIFQW